MKLSTHDPRPTIHALSARRGTLLTAACVALLLSGCANFGYYLQSVSGQLDIWNRQRDIGDILKESEGPEKLRSRLAFVLRVRAFAVGELGLPDNASFRRYSDLGRQYVVWNVFATPELSLKPEQWCFPFVGCVTYRGYFSQAGAERFASGLRQRGLDVHVGGVPAFSTLGWFADPLLSTVIGYSNQRLARLVFHELAHQVVYAKGDTVFNESFAVAVETEGVKRWLARDGSAEDRVAYERGAARREDFARLIDAYRVRLDVLYKSGLEPEAMRARKHEIFAEMLRDYGKLKVRWGGFTGYDHWFAAGLNNAQLASVAIYTQLVPAFQALLAREGGDLQRFYRAAGELARMPLAERHAQLKALLSPPTASAR